MGENGWLLTDNKLSGVQREYCKKKQWVGDSGY